MERLSALSLVIGVLVLAASTAHSAAAAPGWSPPVDLSLADSFGSSPRVGLNSSGDAVVTWYESHDSYNSSVMLARRHPGLGGSFGPPLLISDPPGTDPDPLPFLTTGQNTDPSVAISEAG